MMDRDFDFSGVDVDELLKKNEAQMARIAELGPALEEIVGTGQDEDGLVTVEFVAAGLKDVILHPKAMRLSSGELAARIKEAFTAAAADLQRQTSEAMEELFGEDNPMRWAGNPDGAMEMIHRAESAYNRTFEDVMGELVRIRNRMEG
jgi:DNA-binding protein YbaB